MNSFEVADKLSALEARVAALEVASEQTPKVATFEDAYVANVFETNNRLSADLARAENEVTRQREQLTQLANFLQESSTLSIGPNNAVEEAIERIKYQARGWQEARDNLALERKELAQADESLLHWQKEAKLLADQLNEANDRLAKGEAQTKTLLAERDELRTKVERLTGRLSSADREVISLRDTIIAAGESFGYYSPGED